MLRCLYEITQPVALRLLLWLDLLKFLYCECQNLTCLGFAEKCLVYMYALFVFGVGNVLIWENVLYGIGVSRKFSVFCVCVCYAVVVMFLIIKLWSMTFFLVIFRLWITMNCLRMISDECCSVNSVTGCLVRFQLSFHWLDGLEI